ncbi:MAG: CoA transferase, partial [Acidimicrobiales bacterium]|nr:CoA transferase [Acidimicrobiales bacterium]
MVNHQKAFGKGRSCDPVGVPSASETWASSGLLALTGWPDGPPVTGPAEVAVGLVHLANVIAARGGPVLDGPALSGERAAILGLTRG